MNSLSFKYMWKKHLPYQAMRKSIKPTIFLLAIVLIIFAVFFQSSILHPGHMTVLRLIRSSIFTWLTFTILYIVLDIPTLKDTIKKSKCYYCIFTTLLWIGIYTAVFSRIPDVLQKDIGNYYLVPCLLFSASLLSITYISRLHRALRFLFSLVYTVCTYLLLISAVFFAAYFIIYGQPFDEYALLSVIATNPEEIINYLTATFSSIQLSLLGISIIGSFLLLLACTLRITAVPYTLPISKKKACAAFLLIIYFLINYLATVFPADQVLHLRRLNGPMNAFIQLKNNIDNNTANLTINNQDQTLAQKLPGTVIVVIGESATRNRMSAFTPSYPVNTTPWEKSTSSNQDFFFFTNAYANFPNTVMAVTQALTSANQYNKKQLSHSVDILDVARKAGYHTYWLSLQNKSTVSDAGVTVLADRADTVQWLHGPDETVLEELQAIPVDENNFIIIHLNGSHFRYDRRVPTEFIKKNDLKVSSKEDWYDASLQYTDSVLQQIFEYGKNHLHMNAMVYVSDHGEDMQYTHTSSPFKFDMVRIPFWVYISPAYQSQYTATAAALRKHKQQIFTNDLLFEALSGLIQAPSSEYQSQYDITSPDYSLTNTQALTLHGKKHISEDQ